MKTINTRVPDDAHALLVEAAKEDLRSLNSEMIYLLRLGLEKRLEDQRRRS